MKGRKLFFGMIIACLLLVGSLVKLAGPAEAAPAPFSEHTQHLTVENISDNSKNYSRVQTTLPGEMPPQSPLLAFTPVLTLTKSAQPDPVVAGDVLTYTIVVENGGTSDATGSLITDTLPSSVTVTSTDGGTENGGVVTWNSGTITAGQSITRTLRVTVASGFSGSTLLNTAEVSSTQGITDNVTISTDVNHAPTAVDDGGPAFTTDEDSPFTTGDVRGNDTDPDTSDSLSVESFDDSGTLGTVSDNVDGTFDYDPNGQFESLAVGEQTTDTFSYTVTDGNGGTDTATVTITIDGVNDDPIADDDSGTTNEDTFIDVNVINGDTDPDTTDILSVQSIDTGGTTGQVFNQGGGILRYNPNGQFESLNTGQSTSDTFQYTVTDGNGGTDTATVTITINGNNDEPSNITLSNNDVDENLPANTTVGTFSTTDVDNSTGFNYELVSGSGDTDNASFNISGNTLRTSQLFNYKDGSSYSIRVRSTDAGGLETEKQFTININNVVPVAQVEFIATPDTVPEPGDNVSLTIRVKNVSQEKAIVTTFVNTPYNLSTQCPGIEGTMLDPNEEAVCSFSVSISGNADDVQSSLTTAELTDDEGDDDLVSVSEDVTVTDVPPNTSINVTVNPLSVTEPGSNVTFKIEVTNNSTAESADLTSLTDDVGNIDGRGTCALPKTLAVSGGTYSCSFTQFVPGNFGDPPYTKTVDSVAFDDEGNSVSPQDDATVFIGEIKRVYLPLITKPAPTILSIQNDNTGGNVTVIVRTLAGQKVTQCTVPNNQTQLCDHNGDDSHIFPPGTYTIEVSSNCGSATTQKSYSSGPVTTRIFCK